MAQSMPPEKCHFRILIILSCKPLFYPKAGQEIASEKGLLPVLEEKNILISRDSVGTKTDSYKQTYYNNPGLPLALHTFPSHSSTIYCP